MPDDSVIKELDSKMGKIYGKSGVIEKIENDLDWRIESTIKRFGIDPANATSTSIRDVLLGHLRRSERVLSVFLGGDGDGEFSNFDELIRRGHDLMKPKKLWVLKKEKFREILEENPPPNIMQKFGYKDGKELFRKEKLEEIASSLRFMEKSEWMHEAFDKGYSDLTPDDFEEREVEVVVLSGKWLEAALPFVEKKRHNLSHLKELGIIFIIPIKIDKRGELLRVFALYLHYLYEVQFYSDLFKMLRERNDNFSNGVISLLRGDVLDSCPEPKSDASYNWLIVQRYLAKDNEFDKRLFIPHVNPEGVHWRKAEEALTKLDQKDLSLTFGLWFDLDWVGGYFKNNKRNEEKLVSFDLIDTIMGLVKEDEDLEYLYHQQEALWNHLFTSYAGDGDKFEKLVMENLLRGYITLP